MLYRRLEIFSVPIMNFGGGGIVGFIWLAFSPGH